MPMVRIDIPAATPEADARALSNAVHRALVETFDVPADDRFQTLQRRAPGEIICSPQYLGIHHSAHVAMVQITCSPGRSLAQKRALFARIAQDAEQGAGFAAADVIVHLVETLRENWSFGNGLAHYTLRADS
jgi:4-oxalocrotonate tautomerase